MAESAHGATPDPVLVARKLLRAARVGTLATQSGGFPFAGLVTPATEGDLSVLLLLSDLSEHTKQLRRDPRCALLVAGAAAEANPQTTPRVTVAGTAAIADAAALRARFLAIHPYAALYAGFGDFHLWRIVPEEALLVAGFAQAHRLRPERLLPAPAAVTAVAASAPEIMAHCNADHAETLAPLAGRAGGVADGGRGRGRLRSCGRNESTGAACRVAAPRCRRRRRTAVADPAGARRARRLAPVTSADRPPPRRSGIVMPPGPSGSSVARTSRASSQGEAARLTPGMLAPASS